MEIPLNADSVSAAILRARRQNVRRPNCLRANIRPTHLDSRSQTKDEPVASNGTGSNRIRRSKPPEVDIRLAVLPQRPERRAHKQALQRRTLPRGKLNSRESLRPARTFEREPG